MQREKVKTIGISILGGNSGVEGPYELGIDEIRAVNEEDVTTPPRKHLVLLYFSRILMKLQGKSL